MSGGEDEKYNPVNSNRWRLAIRGVSLTETLELWRQVADGFSERLEAVGPSDWSSPTCCELWDVTKLVNHAIGAQRMVPKALGATGDIDADGDDLVEVWKSVRGAADNALSAPGVFDKTVKLPFGEMSAKDGFGFPFGDLLVHSWDLARAIGADDRLIPEACAAAYATLEPIDALLRAPGFFGPKLEPAADADIQDRLLAFVGRRV
jgi:uncharacterized protein (TIGR03086 family)